MRAHGWNRVGKSERKLQGEGNSDFYAAASFTTVFYFSETTQKLYNKLLTVLTFTKVRLLGSNLPKSKNMSPVKFKRKFLV